MEYEDHANYRCSERLSDVVVSPATNNKPDWDETDKPRQTGRESEIVPRKISAFLPSHKNIKSRGAWDDKYGFVVYMFPVWYCLLEAWEWGYVTKCQAG